MKKNLLLLFIAFNSFELVFAKKANNEFTYDYNKCEEDRIALIQALRYGDNLLPDIQKRIPLCANINKYHVRKSFDRNSLPSLQLSELVSVSDCLLHQAAGMGNESIVNTLLKSNVDPNEEDERGYNPLYYANRYDRKAIVDALIGAINKAENRDETDILDIDFF